MKGGVGRWGELGVSQTALWNQGRWKGWGRGMREGGGEEQDGGENSLNDDERKNTRE